MNDTWTGISGLVGEHGMHYTVLLTQACLMKLALSNIIYLHAIVTFWRKEKFAFIGEVYWENGALAWGWLSRSRTWRISTKELFMISTYNALLSPWGSRTFVGRKMDIMSGTLAVLGIPFEVLTRPLGTGESIAIGVEDMSIYCIRRPQYFSKILRLQKTLLPQWIPESSHASRNVIFIYDSHDTVIVALQVSLLWFSSRSRQSNVSTPAAPNTSSSKQQALSAPALQI